MSHEKRVTISGISMPSTTANFFAKEIEEVKGKKINIDPNYKLFLESCNKTSDLSLKKFFKTKMIEIQDKSDEPTKEYYLWFGNNIANLGLDKFGDLELYLNQISSSNPINCKSI
ncbi:MAG: hypothetical protein H0U57_03430 [Tatlockia sp.]|nr:hypothetical protein [Tatlockia sp.]